MASRPWSPGSLEEAWRAVARWRVPPRWRRPLLYALAVVAVGVAGFFVYMKLVEEGFIRYNKWDRRVRGTLRVGDQAPDVELARYDGSPLRLSTLWRERPVVLVFGSCT